MLWKFGNSRIGDDTLILNMGSATDCPAKKLGYCKLGSKCYALKSERMYPVVLDYRTRQGEYWLGNSAIDIAFDLSLSIDKRRKTTKWFRFNESGDFYSQECIDKLNIIAEILRGEFNIVTFGYTARKDLDFSSTEFVVRGSGFLLPMGKTFIVPKDTPIGWNEELNATVCSGDCKTCTLTRSPEHANIAMRLN